MKTCQFRGAQPRSITEGVFCSVDEPNGKYQFHLCHQHNCHLCSRITSNDIDFSSSSTHEFINGYRTYLNCPVVSCLHLLINFYFYF